MFCLGAMIQSLHISPGFLPLRSDDSIAEYQSEMDADELWKGATEKGARARLGIWVKGVEAYCRVRWIKRIRKGDSDGL